MESMNRSRDISIIQLLTRLVVETERMIKLADDINQYSTTAQAKSSLALIGIEVKGILGRIKTSIVPLYNLYEIDPGLKAAKPHLAPIHADDDNLEWSEYDESALWSDVKKQNP